MKPLAFLCALFAASVALAADNPAGELIGDPKIIAPLAASASSHSWYARRSSGT